MWLKKNQVVAIGGLVLAVAIFMLVYRPVSLGGDTQHFVVSSGSMEPAVPVGSVVIIKSVDTDTLKKGDIICFKLLHMRVTHRITEITYNGFITKGDANEDPDRLVVETKDIIGKVIFIVPYLGHLSYFVRTPLGFALFIILPVTIIIAGQMKIIINHRKTTNQQMNKITSSTRREQ